MKIRLLLFALCILMLPKMMLAQPTSAQEKQDFRGVWVATVVNLDWPANRTATVASQKADLIAKFDKMKETGMNVIFFQIRTENDALYDSPYEPWSYWLTGEQGKAPNPLWDPLEFAVAEAHKRGMELHAWFNPYRSVRNTGTYTQHSSHVSVTDPEWILQFGTLKILNPGIPAVIDYTTKIVMDVVRRYDVDGVHFDDYFYPYAPNTISNQDAATYAEFKGDFTNVADWRRDNVNRMIKAVHDSIKTAKPHVKFGISPFGIWRPGNPEGIVGTDAYATLYADAKAWITDESVDYLLPQLYWAFGGGQDYAKLAPWWGIESKNRHLYTGNAVYKMEGSWNWPTSEIGNQVRFNRTNSGILGQTYFRSRLLQNNLKGIADSLKTDWQRHPALPPTMDWLNVEAPPAPVDITWDWVNQIAHEVEINWSKPTYEKAGDDTLLFYAVYRVLADAAPDAATVTASASNLIAVTGETSFSETLEPSDDNYYYFVTSVSRNSVESESPTAIEVVTSTSINDGNDLVTRVELHQNYPNPFNPTTQIRFDLGESNDVQIEVFNVMGQRVATLFSGYQSAGSHSVAFDATSLASGVYMYRLTTPNAVITKSMMLVK